MRKVILGLISILLTTGCAGEFDLDASHSGQVLEDARVSGGPRSPYKYSQEIAESLVAVYYQKFLFRDPDESGLAHYAQLIRTGELKSRQLSEALSNSLEAYALRMWIDMYLDRQAIDMTCEKLSECENEDVRVYYGHSGRRDSNIEAVEAADQLTKPVRSYLVLMIKNGRSFSYIERKLGRYLR